MERTEEGAEEKGVEDADGARAADLFHLGSMHLATQDDEDADRVIAPQVLPIARVSAWQDRGRRAASARMRLTTRIL